MRGLTLDPVFGVSLRTALALLFLWAGIHKLRGAGAFRAALENYRVLPEAMAAPVAAAFIVIEILVALTLIVSASPIPAIVTASLLALYSLAIVINLWRGRRYIDCGCAGPAARQPISEGLILRNALLIIAAMAAALPTTPRDLIWIDTITIAATVIVLALLYATLDTLIANTPAIGAQALTAARPQGPAGGPGGGA